MSIQTTQGTTLSAIRVIRLAWFDEKLDAEARGDEVAALRAHLQLTACEEQISRLEKRSDAPARRFLMGLMRRS